MVARPIGIIIRDVLANNTRRICSVFITGI